jgi:hypothetical protein
MRSSPWFAPSRAPAHRGGGASLAFPNIAGDGRVVVGCGFQYNQTISGVTTTSGTRYRRAYLRID